jgi:hypothetical protein
VVDAGFTIRFTVNDFSLVISELFAVYCRRFWRYSLRSK